MTEYEIKQIQEYLNKKFSSNKFVAKKRKSIDDSCEIFLDDEFIGLVYVEDDEGEISYQFHMTILKEDFGQFAAVNYKASREFEACEYRTPFGFPVVPDV